MRYNHKDKYLKSKGFAVSGVLYPILILTLFLIVQILSMMASRKVVLDKNKQELLDSVNRSNKIYTNEELSILVGEQKELIESQKSKITSLENTLKTYQTNFDTFKGTQEAYNKDIPIGNYDLYLGDFLTTSTTYQNFGTSYHPSAALYNTQGWSPSKQVKVCVVASTTARGPHDNTYAYVRVKMGTTKEIEIPFTTWGSVETGVSSTVCSKPSTDYLDTVNNPHWTFDARTTSSYESIHIYRVYLLAYKA